MAEKKCFTETELLVIGTDIDRKTGALRAFLMDDAGSYAGAAFIGLAGHEYAPGRKTENVQGQTRSHQMQNKTGAGASQHAPGHEPKDASKY
jgi:hypothetical protein